MYVASYSAYQWLFLHMVFILLAFIEIKMRYCDILLLMPDDYKQTLNKLRSYISSDEIAGVLDSDNPKDANKRILDCLINKMKKREEMLNFCVQLEQIITSQELKIIISEIQTGTYVCSYSIMNN